MKKLSKTLVKEKEALQERLLRASDALTTALEEYNSAVSAAFEKLMEVYEPYKEVRQASWEFLNERVAEMEEYESERSEKWADSDAGVIYTSWRDSYVEVRDILEVSDDPEQPSELEMEHEGMAEAMADLSTEPDENF